MKAILEIEFVKEADIQTGSKYPIWRLMTEDQRIAYIKEMWAIYGGRWSYSSTEMRYINTYCKNK